MGLPDKWTRASVIGSLWAANEIILGSFLHNLQVPLSGTILAFISVSLLVAFSRIWEGRGMILRAGLICAVMKSLSPSAIILGPMIGILLEAFFLELSIRTLGRNIAGYLVGGALAVLSVILQKIVKLLILFGNDLIQVAYNFYQYALRIVGTQDADPWVAVGIVLSVYALAGMTASVIGYFTGAAASQSTLPGEPPAIDALKGELFKRSDRNNYHSWLLLLHLAAIILFLFMLDKENLFISLIPASLYVLVTALWYRSSFRHLKKPGFWIQLVILTFLASIFWNGFSQGKIWDKEGILVGLTMNLRAAVVLLGFSAISVELRNPFIRSVLYERGWRNFYLALELAFSSLPMVTGYLPPARMFIKNPTRAISRIIRDASMLLPVFRKTLANLPKIIVITGSREQGKTQLMKEVVEVLKMTTAEIRGFTAEAIHENDQRTGYFIVDVHTGDQRELCHLSSSAARTLKLGRFYFDPETIDFGLRLLTDDCEKARVFIIDEVGPLEMKGMGWAAAIERISGLEQPLMIWSVRPELVKKVTVKWPAGEIRVFEAGSSDAGEIARLIKEWMNTKTISRS